MSRFGWSAVRIDLACWCDGRRLTLLRLIERAAAAGVTGGSVHDALIAATALHAGARLLTRDALETTFATNHMSYFVMTLGLADRLLAVRARRSAGPGA